MLNGSMSWRKGESWSLEGTRTAGIERALLCHVAPANRRAGNELRSSAKARKYTALSVPTQRESIEDTNAALFSKTVSGFIHSVSSCSSGAIPCWAWGNDGHRFITGEALTLLPDPIRPFFERHRAFVVEHSIDPDLWRLAGFDGGDDSPFSRFGRLWQLPF